MISTKKIFNLKQTDKLTQKKILSRKTFNKDIINFLTHKVTPNSENGKISIIFQKIPKNNLKDNQKKKQKYFFVAQTPIKNEVSIKRRMITKTLSVNKTLLSSELNNKAIRTLQLNNEYSKEIRTKDSLSKSNSKHHTGKKDLIFPYLNMEEKNEKWNIMNLGKNFTDEPNKNKITNIKSRMVFYNKYKTSKEMKLKKCLVLEKLRKSINKNNAVNCLIKTNNNLSLEKSRNVSQELKNNVKIKIKRIPSYIRAPNINKILFPQNILKNCPNNSYELNYGNKCYFVNNIPISKSLFDSCFFKKKKIYKIYNN